MGWWSLGMGMAMAASPYEGEDATMRTEAVVVPAPEEALARLADLAHMRGVFERYGAGCAHDLDVGEPTSGPGAAGRITWTPSWMHRRYTVRVDEAGPSRVVWDHTRGQGGFYLIFRVEAEGEGSRVRVEAPMDPMPWPVRKVWHEQVLPTWSSCLASALVGL